MNYIKYRDKIIEYQIDKGKRKHIYISIQDGNVIVKAPKRVSNKYIEEIVEKRKEWIYDKISSYMNSSKKPKEYVNGERLKVLTEDCILNITYENIKKAKVIRNEKYINVYIPEKYRNIENRIEEKELIKKLINKYYTDIAWQEVEIIIQKLIERTGLKPNEYRIRNLKRSWGNCSSTRNISINKDIAMYSRKAVEYVCLHELCHLKFMNHSKQFWSLVERYMPDYKIAELELKKQ